MNGIDYNAYFKDVEEDMVDALYRWALANREPLTSYAVEMLSYGESLCGKYVKDFVLVLMCCGESGLRGVLRLIYTSCLKWLEVWLKWC